jgi:hypothetical protein
MWKKLDEVLDYLAGPPLPEDWRILIHLVTDPRLWPITIFLLAVIFGIGSCAFGAHHSPGPKACYTSYGLRCLP